ncbi:MAG: hypothetical protein H6Q87_1408 [candidate division NC10 bacterium]|nr:hypothetical protein [candidate division NC10 bacterium]
MSKMCERCGREMPDGSLAYEVRIDVYADFDGVLVPPEAGRAADEELRELVARMADQNPDALMRDVYHRERHLLCRECRDRYLANPLNLPLPDGGLP